MASGNIVSTDVGISVRNEIIVIKLDSASKFSVEALSENEFSYCYRLYLNKTFSLSTTSIRL